MDLLMAFGFILCSLLFLFVLKDISKPPSYPPGPAWFPFVGSYLQVHALKSRLRYFHLVWTELARQYGPLVGLRLGKDRVVVVSGYHAVKEVLTRDDCTGRPDGFYFRMRTFNKRLGVAFTDGDLWQKHRHFTMLHLRQLGLGRDGMERLISTESQALVEMLKEKCKSTEGTELPLHNLCSISVINTLWTVVAGQRYELDDPKLHEMLDFNNMFFKNVDMSGGILNHFPFLRYIAPDITGYTALRTSVDGLLHNLQESIEEHKKTFDPEHTRDLIDTYIKEIYAQKDDPASTFSEEQLLSVCLDLFMGGSETTTGQLGFFILLMMHHPDVQMKIQKEIDTVVGRDRVASFADRPMLPYLNATIMEVQRFLGVAPATVAHKTLKDCKISGFRIPKDTMLMISLWSVHMDVDHWGDPHVFRPDRFLDDTAQNVIKDEWLMPFGLGKHRCLAEDLAKNNMFLFLCGLLQNFSFDLLPEETPPSLDPLDDMSLSPQPFAGLVTPR